MRPNGHTQVFGDAANARRALFSLGQAIRLSAPAPVEGGMTDGDQAAAPAAEARIDPVWRRGPNYEKAGYEYAVLMRQVMTSHGLAPYLGAPWCKEARGGRGARLSGLR